MIAFAWSPNLSLDLSDAEINNLIRSANKTRLRHL
jgi:hypothetical protein